MHLPLLRTTGVLFTAALMAVMVMGNTKCSTGTFTSSSSGSTGVSAGGGAVAIHGLNITVKNARGQAITAATLAATAAWAHHTLIKSNSGAASAGGSAGNAANLPTYGLGDPCSEYKNAVGGKRNTAIFPDEHKIATFQARRFRGVGYPFLDCGGMRKAVSDHGLPARMKSIAKCIAVILARGNYVVDGAFTIFSYQGGSVSVETKTARITDTDPVGGGWTRCAREA